ncbi:MAG TPA: TerB family tellurite resistance protein [Longimicrobiales bacterium]|nr:TerB family tellurite resistance protein [Longimicrobiales bacterium]
MLEPIRTFFQRNIAIDIDSGGAHARPAPAAQEKLHVAACALLLELAHADDEFADIERSHIEAVLQRHFGLEPQVARELIELAEYERANAIDLFQFTTLIRNSYDLGQKTLLAEIMWGLVLTDGQIARHESYMLRKIANLLDLEPGYLSSARRRVEDSGA